MPSDPSKTEKATPKRRKKAREEGQVPKSEELSKFVILLFALVVVYMMMDTLTESMSENMVWFFKESNRMDVKPMAVNNLMLQVVERMAYMLMPILLTLSVGAIIIMRVQVGSLWSTKVLEPKFKKIFDIPGGIKRMFSPESFVRMARSMAGAFAVGIGPYLVLRGELDNMMPLFYQPSSGVAAYMLETAAIMILYSLVPMALIALADTFYSFWKYEDQLKMSKDEVKDERRQMDGDPKIKAKQKEKMLAMSQRRMLQNVAKADVIVTNPTHISVALLYDPSQAPAPIVVAKGADHLAKKIRELAREHKVPLRENKPLARALYEQTEVGDIIPEALYKAVATILARLRKLKKSGN